MSQNTVNAIQAKRRSNWGEGVEEWCCFRGRQGPRGGKMDILGKKNRSARNVI